MPGAKGRMLQSEPWKLANGTDKTMWTRRSISVLPLSLTGALHGCGRSYQITQHSSNVLHISTLTRYASTLPHPLPPPAWSHISIQSLQTFAGQTLLNSEDGFAHVRAHNHQYGNYELFHAVKVWGRLWKSKRKSEDPYAISREKGRIIFQSAHATCSPWHKSSVYLEPFENHRLLTGSQTCKCTHLCIGSRGLH